MTPSAGLTGNRAYVIPVYTAGGVLLAVPTVQRRADKSYLNLNCFNGCKLYSYALRAPLASGPALVLQGGSPAAAATLTAASPVISALATAWRSTRSGSIKSGVGAGLYTQSGGGANVYFGVYTCRAVPAAPACVVAGPTVELIGEIMSPVMFGDSITRSYVLNVDGSLSVRPASPVSFPLLLHASI